MLDLFEAEQQRILLLDPKERAMQHNYQRTMAVCYELRTFIRSIDAKPSAVLEAAPASSASAQAVDARAYHFIEYGMTPEDWEEFKLWMNEKHCPSEQSQQSPVQASDAGRQG